MDIIWYWVGFFVRETRSASNILDLMARTPRLLQAFESSILARRNVEIIQLVNQRNAFTQKILTLQQAMNMQHQGLQHMRQLVSQYQKQVEKLEAQQQSNPVTSCCSSSQ